MKKLLKKIIPTQLFLALVPAYHIALGVAANIRYGFPARKLHIIGVTGTNGKTTTTTLIFTMLREAGYKVGFMTTVDWGYGHEVQKQVVHITTVSSPEMQRRLRDFRRKGVEWVVIETSSHALAQHRVLGLPYEIAVLTNVTHEHLDYHGTFEKYREAKRKLFKMTAKSKRSLGIVNIEDPAAELFANTTKRHLYYGLKEGDVHADNVKLGREDIRYTAVAGDEKYDIHMRMPGEFNVYNSMAAVLVGREIGLSKKQVEQGIAALDGVEGRMMSINEGQPFAAMIDHAGTPDAFERFFKTTRPQVKGKLVVVFGSPGRRDVVKRPLQGEIAGKYADEVILTEEDDRDEPGEKIMNEIARGAIKAGKVLDKDLFLIGRRDEAIEFAVSRVGGKDDMVVTLGKGQEKTIERGEDTYAWSEPETMRMALRKSLKK
ncbi:UDP-N-acetylmuramoyl-L-alanyl-D-glutamate--2,6-diaminopimelate ligase [soil metagenome]